MRSGCGEICVNTNERKKLLGFQTTPNSRWWKSHLTRYICQSAKNRIVRGWKEQNPLSPAAHKGRCALRVCWWVWHFAARASQFVNQIMKLETPLSTSSQQQHGVCIYVYSPKTCRRRYYIGAVYKYTPCIVIIEEEAPVGSKMTLSHPSAKQANFWDHFPHWLCNWLPLLTC